MNEAFQQDMTDSERANQFVQPRENCSPALPLAVVGSVVACPQFPMWSVDGLCQDVSCSTRRAIVEFHEDIDNAINGMFYADPFAMTSWERAEYLKVSRGLVSRPIDLCEVLEAVALASDPATPLEDAIAYACYEVDHLICSIGWSQLIEGPF